MQRLTNTLYFHITLGHFKIVNCLALSKLPRNNPAISRMVWTNCNYLTYENKIKKKYKNMENCTSIYWHSWRPTCPTLLHLLTWSFFGPLGHLGSTALHISNYAAALSTAVTHQLTPSSSSLIPVTWCSDGQASLAWSANSWAAH